MNTRKQGWLVAAISTALLLSGCGGGGGGSPSASTTTSAAPTTATTPPPDPQLWLPYYKDTYVDGNITTVDHLSVASTTLLPSKALVTGGNVTLMTSGQGGADQSNVYDNTAQTQTDSSGLTRYVGSRFFFYLSAGQLYRLDLTSTTVPSPVKVGNIGLTQLCSINTEQTDQAGKQGNVLVSGFDSPGATPSSCGSSTQKSWIVPITGDGSTATPPLGFYVKPLFAFHSSTATTGYLTESVTGALYVTKDLSQQGVQVKDSQGNFISDTGAQVLEHSGDGQHIFVNTTNYTVSPSRSTIYSISDAGDATLVYSFDHSYFGALGNSDANGDLFLFDARPPVSGSTNGILNVYKAGPTGGAATQLTQLTIPNVTSAFSLNSYQISPDGQKFIVTVITNLSPLTERTYAFDASTGIATAIASLDDKTPYFYPFGNASTLVFRNPSVSGVQVYNLSTASVTGTLNGYIYGGGAAAGATFMTKNGHSVYLRDMIVGPQVAQPYLMWSNTTPPAIQACGAMSLPIDLIDMSTGSTRASFTAPNNSCATTGTSIAHTNNDFLSGKTYDVSSKLGRLFVVAPALNAPLVTTIETDTPTTTVNGQTYSEQWSFAG